MASQVRLDEKGWEESDFPIVCESCLGDNPYIRMVKMGHYKACKICERPFTVFRWKPGTEARFKKTEVCQTCAKLKNVCQTCILDLNYSLPVQVRDQLSGMTSKVDETDQVIIPKSDVHREYVAGLAEAKLNAGGVEGLPFANANSNPELLRLARSKPYYERNKAHVCSFFLKGECKRGETCPYRHEVPDHDKDLANQNIKDRYYGVDDPVARKIMSRASQTPELVAPEDPTIATLYVGGVDNLRDEDLRKDFYIFGEISTINLVPEKKCAFVEYRYREDAERAARQLHNTLVVRGQRARVSWAHGGAKDRTTGGGRSSGSRSHSGSGSGSGSHPGSGSSSGSVYAALSSAAAHPESAPPPPQSSAPVPATSTTSFEEKFLKQTGSNTGSGSGPVTASGGGNRSGAYHPYAVPMPANLFPAAPPIPMMNPHHRQHQHQHQHQHPHQHQHQHQPYPNPNQQHSNRGPTANPNHRPPVRQMYPSMDPTQFGSRYDERRSQG